MTIERIVLANFLARVNVLFDVFSEFGLTIDVTYADGIRMGMFTS